MHTLVLLVLPALSRALSVKSCTQTSEDRSSLLATCPRTEDAESTWSLTLDLEPQQSIDGFGASWTDATTLLFDGLSESSTDDIMAGLFGDGEGGIKLELMRMTVGQSDLTPISDGRWSFDESVLPDPSLKKFRLGKVGDRMLKWVAAMLEISGDITLLGSIWSPPGWMKQNNNLRWEYRGSYVNYIVSFLQAYSSAGVKLDAITLQNEPLHSAAPAWTMHMDESYAAILTNLTADAIQSGGFDTKLWAYDHNTDHPEYPQYVVDNVKDGAVDAVAWHCYGGGFSPLRDFGAKNPGIKQYMTECWLHELTGGGFFDLPQFIMRPVQNGASGAMAWTLAGSVDLDVSYPGGCDQCTGLIQVNRTDATYEFSRDFYAMGQFSKFVKKGAKFLGTTGDHIYDDNTGVESAGFINPDGEILVIIMNKFNDDLKIDFQLQGAEGGSVVHVLKPRTVTTLTLK